MYNYVNYDHGPVGNAIFNATLRASAFLRRHMWLYWILQFTWGHNVGSVFRSSDAFRVEAVYLCGITATPPHPEIHKTALGGEDSVTWRYFETATEAVAELQKEGVFVYSIEQVEGSTKLQNLQLDTDRRYAVVFGNEVKGVHQEVVDLADGCLEIPQFGTKHSLNVSVTAGIVIWEVAKQFLERLKL